MKKFGELKLIGNASEQKKLISLVEERLSENWIRDRLRESELKSQNEYDYIIFSCLQTSSRPAVELSFIADTNGYLYVCNIIPKNIGELKKDDYNAILEEFSTQFIEPAAEGLDIRVITSVGDKTIDSAMSPEMSRLLKKFSAAANKSSSGTHPLDEKRFFDFIVQAHNEKALLDEEELRELLVDDGWPFEQAQRISSKYCFARDLLSHYSEQ